MSFVQIEKGCQDSINRIHELLNIKKDDLRNSISLYEKINGWNIFHQYPLVMMK